MTYGRKEYIDGPRLYPSNADLSQSYGQGSICGFPFDLRQPGRQSGYSGGQGTHESNYESWKSTKIQGKFTKNGICPQVSKGQEASSTLSGKRKLGGWGTKIPDYIMEELQGQKELAVTVPGM